LLEKTNNKLLEKTNNSEPLNIFNKKCQVNINFGRAFCCTVPQIFLLLTRIYQHFNTTKSSKSGCWLHQDCTC